MTGGKNQVEEKYILTIDMGTTAFKSAIFDCRGREVSSATEEYQIQTPQPGWAEMDPDRYIDLFQNVIAKAIEKAQVPKSQLITLGISVQGETSVFLDADKKSLRPAILWCDTRALKEAEEIVDAFGCCDHTESYRAGGLRCSLAGCETVVAQKTRAWSVREYSAYPAA